MLITSLAASFTAATQPPNSTFCSPIIGRVFWDANKSGDFDDGDSGIADVKLATVSGAVVTSDMNGRFYIPCLDYDQRQVGRDAARNQRTLLKLDERSLPLGYWLPDKAPKDVIQRVGGLARFDFIVAKARSAKLELRSEAFKAGSTELDRASLERLTEAIGSLKSERSVLTVIYSLGPSEDLSSGQRRVESVKQVIETMWQASSHIYKLDVATVVNKQTN